MSDWNQAVIDQLRAGSPRIQDTFDRDALLILHTTGARTGQERLSPLAFLRDFDGSNRLLIVASAAGRDEHPSWYFNIVANSEVTVEFWEGDEFRTVKATATVADPAERTSRWPQITAAAPGFARYETLTERVIPVILIQPV